MTTETTPRCRGCGEKPESSSNYCQRCKTEKVHAGFTREALTEAFDLVRDIENWKNPISTNIESIYVDQVRVAIEFFAGGGADFQSNHDGTVHVTAPGYYRLIGA